MDSNKAERIARLVNEKKELENLISWHENKCFVFADITIATANPMHSQLLSIFQERLKYVKSELEAE